MIKYPTLDAIEALLSTKLEKTGTVLTFLNKSNFLFILESIREVGENNEKNNETTALVTKTSYLIAKIIDLHPLADGNKRAAAILALFFLATNGKKLQTTHDEFYGVLLGFARHVLKENDISN